MLDVETSSSRCRDLSGGWPHATTLRNPRLLETLLVTGRLQVDTVVRSRQHVPFSFHVRGTRRVAAAGLSAARRRDMIHVMLILLPPVGVPRLRPLSRTSVRRAVGFDALRGFGGSVEGRVPHRARSTSIVAVCCPSVSVSSGCSVGTSGLEMDGAMSLESPRQVQRWALSSLIGKQPALVGHGNAQGPDTHKICFRKGVGQSRKHLPSIPTEDSNVNIACLTTKRVPWKRGVK